MNKPQESVQHFQNPRSVVLSGLGQAQTWRGSRRYSYSWVCRRSRAAGTTGWGSSHQGPRRSGLRRRRSRWSALDPCVWGQTWRPSLMSCCPPEWYAWSEVRGDILITQGNSALVRTLMSPFNSSLVKGIYKHVVTVCASRWALLSITMLFV